MAALALACGCGAGDASGGGDAGGGRDATGKGGGSGGSGGTQASIGGSASEPSPTPLQPPLFGNEDPEVPTGRKKCDKVDFLYVVDNSASMVDKQANLARSFIGFSRIVEETLGTNDHQIMVVDTDAGNVNDVLNGRDRAGELDMCTGMLGVGLRTGADGEECGINGSQRYLRNEQGNLADAFSCLAQVGVLGNVDERPMDALLAATSAPRSGAADGDVEECNSGFLRDDAILVVTIITDEEDDQSSGDPSSWRRSLLEVKRGNEQGIVVLGLIADNEIPGGLPGDGACDETNGTPSPRLQRFVESFELGSLGSVCSPDYSSFFADAVSRIDTACEVFDPTLY
jgi:hypothetical protein